MGKRLRPFTNGRPKAMLPVGIEKKPMLEFVIKPWVKLGIKNFVFCTRYKSESIENHFGNGKGLGIEINYVNAIKNYYRGIFTQDFILYGILYSPASF